MEYMIKVLAVITVFTSSIPLISSKYIKGTLVTFESWEFLARFCYLPRNGRIDFVLEYPLELEPESLLFYYDRETQWPSVYKKGLTCEEMISPPHINSPGQQILLGANSPWCTLNDKMIHCKGWQMFTSSREMWWYLAISRCINTTYPGIYMKYELHMTNGNESEFRREFSADEFYILEVDIAFLIACLILLILASVSADILRKKLMFHTTYKIFMFSLTFECMYLLIMSISYGSYSKDGIEINGLKMFGRILEVITILSFILVLLLMAKGFTITRGRFSTCGAVKITLFMSLYAITYAILIIYDANLSDPGEVVYLYQSPPGYGILGLRLLAWLYFTYGTFMNLKHYQEKSKFYIPFYILFSIWFWAGFIVVLVANFALDKWARARVINGVDCAVAFGGFLFLLFLTRPSNSNKNFPYHVRTSQIDIFTDDGMDDLGERRYAPQNTNDKGPDLTAMFTITKSNQLQSSAVGGLPVTTDLHILPGKQESRAPQMF